MSAQELVMDSDQHSLEEQKIIDAKRYKRIKFFTPIRGMLNGAAAVFDGYYLTYFLTDIYKFPVAFTGALSIVTIIITWLFSPVFAAFTDRFRFKKSKFWPWMIMGSTVMYISYIMVMSLPAFNIANTSVLAPVAFALVIIVKLTGQISMIPGMGISPLVTKSTKERQFLAQASKIGHEAGKAVWGYLIPLFLGAASALVGNINIAFAISAVVLFIFGWSDSAINSLFCVKGSYIEREAMKQSEKEAQQKPTLPQMLKVLFTNRPVFGMFLFFILHKIVFFIYTIYGVSVYDHIFEKPESVGLFFTIFSVSAVAGVFCGRLWTRVFKESKRSCCMAMVVHIAFTVLIALTFSRLSISLFLVFFAISSFFMGMLETWVTPLYTACAEYGRWKTGVTMNALVMSTYGLTVSTALAIPPIIATALLKPESYNEGLTFFFTWVPLILAVAALLSLVFIYNLNDTKIKMIQEDIDAGKTRSTSELRI